MTIYDLACAVIGLFINATGHMTIRGLDNIPASGGCLLVPNHRSYADPPIVGAACSRSVRFMAKSELFKMPVLGRIMVAVGSFPVKRGAPDRGALRKALELLAAGEVVCIFPEGTRMAGPGLGQCEPGAGLIALQTMAPVVPVGLKGSDTFLPRHSLLLHRHAIEVNFGPPLQLDDLRGGKPDRTSVEEAGRRMMAGIADALGLGLEDQP